MANQYTKLFIDNQEIDLLDSEELPLNITKRVNNIEGKVQGDFSRASVTVPATKNNINILGRTRQFYSFRIEVDGVPSFNGTARVRQGKTYSNGYGAIECNYEINLVSNNSSWFVLLGETLLSELTQEVAPFNAPNIVSGFIGDPAVHNWAFCLIKWKEWANFVGGTHYAPSIFESTPALFMKPLVIEAFNSIGYSVISDFFETDLGKRLILPTPVEDKLPKEYNDEYLNTKVSLAAPTTYGLVNITPYPFDTIDTAAPSNPTAYSLGTFQYTAPLAGYYEIKADFVFGNVAPAPPYFFLLQLYQNGSVVSPLDPIGFAFDNTGASAPYPTAGVILSATGVIFMNVGDTCSWRYATNGGVTVNTAVMTVNGEAILTSGIDIDFKFFLKDWGFLDFFKGLICAFNLSIETDDDARIVTIEPKDAYVATNRKAATSILTEGFYKSETKDYSKIIDYSRTGKFKFPNIKGRFDYLWNSDDEETITFIEAMNQFKVYESRFPMSSGSGTSSREKKEVPFFAKSIHVLDHETRFPGTNRVPQFPLIYPQNYILDPTANEADYGASPRIFFHAGQRLNFEELDGQIEFFEFPGVAQKLPMTFMVNYNDDTGLDPNLGFNNEIINGVNSVGLMQRFYLQELARNDKGELRENYVLFNSVDNNNFTFRIKGIIDSQRYVVQEITGFNPLKDSPTNFKFYLDVYPNASDVANIQNSPLTGVVSLLSTV